MRRDDTSSNVPRSQTRCRAGRASATRFQTWTQKTSKSNRLYSSSGSLILIKVQNYGRYSRSRALPRPCDCILRKLIDTSKNISLKKREKKPVLAPSCDCSQHSKPPQQHLTQEEPEFICWSSAATSAEVGSTSPLGRSAASDPDYPDSQSSHHKVTLPTSLSSSH